MAQQAIQDKDVEAWLSECRTSSTRNAYIYGSNIFFNWLKKNRGISLQNFKLLSPKEMKTLVLQFQNSKPMSEGRIYKSKHKHKDTGSHERVMAPRPLSNNAVSSVLTAIQSFCMYLEKPLWLKGKRITGEDDNHSHYFANGDLEKMFDVCDLKGKAIIATAASLGWEVSDFLALDRKLIEDHIKKAESEGKQYVFFETRRTKTHVPRLAVLNPLAIKSLKEWLAINPTNTLFDMTKSGITKFMKATAKKANLKTTGPVRFHRIRAWTFNSLLKAGLSEPEAKYIVGKAIPHSDSTYLRLRSGIEEKYPKLYDAYLNIKSEKVVDSELKETLEAKTSEMETMKQQITDLQKRLEEQSRYVGQLLELASKPGGLKTKKYIVRRIKEEEP